ncbi:MAG: helix-turn-helix transcriptional regulator [Chitinophagales bacterium]|nr:helix-turn-helix transcriptional regulator [Chitinophagales bacterium]
MSEIIHIKSISEAHRLLGIKKPLHPLVSVCRHAPNMNLNVTNVKVCFDFYIISLKSDIKGQINYGRNIYDFEEGTMLYSYPGQVFSISGKPVIDIKGWTLFIHPDFFRKSSLYHNIHQYGFFSYDANEALHISEKEKTQLTEIVHNIESEITYNLDRHSQGLILHNIESILKYSQRFYDRQFFTRTNQNKDYIIRFEQYLNTYFDSDKLSEQGIPNTEQCGEALNMSGRYLSDLLKVETGKTIKEHIYIKLIDTAKTQLLNSNISIKSLAWELGFEYPQNFSKLFKNKTGMSPKQFRNLS